MFLSRAKYTYILFAPLFLLMNLCPFLSLENFFFLLLYKNSLHTKNNPLPYVVNILFLICLLILVKVSVVFRGHSVAQMLSRQTTFIFCLWWPSQEYRTFKICFWGKDSVFGITIGKKRKTIIWPSFTITWLPQRGRMHSSSVKSGDHSTADPAVLKYFLLA